MISVHGVLTVKQINGSNGKFCSGDLNCDLGEFKVKETILDQFEEGRYEGDFVIERFYLSTYIWRGKSMTDIRAKVTAICLDSVDEGKVEDTPMEPDPIGDSETKAPVPLNIPESVGNIDSADQDAANSEQVANTAPSENSVAKEHTDSSKKEAEALPEKSTDEPEVDALAAIFGDELAKSIMAVDAVKLDPTVDRSLFREQRGILKDRGYQFDAMTQTWFKNQESMEMEHAN